MNRRTEARQCALQMLYLVDQNPDVDLTWVRQNIDETLDHESLADFAWALFVTVREHQATIDQQIVAVAANWKMHRMAVTDRNLLRLGTCEIQHMGTPAAVVLNECVELARQFGTEHSSSFVNGILDKIAKSDLPTHQDQ